MWHRFQISLWIIAQPIFSRTCPLHGLNISIFGRGMHCNIMIAMSTAFVTTLTPTNIEKLSGSARCLPIRAKPLQPKINRNQSWFEEIAGRSLASQGLGTGRSGQGYGLCAAEYNPYSGPQLNVLALTRSAKLRSALYKYDLICVV